MADDEFDALLKRCSQSLSEIHLEIPALDVSSTRRVQKFHLSPPPPPPPAPAAAVPPPAPPPRAPAPVLAPVAPEPEETEIFPPLSTRTLTPPPVRLPRVEEDRRRADRSPKPARAPEPAPVRSGARPWPALLAAVALALTALGVWTYRRAPDEVQLSLDSADAMAFRPESADLVVAQGSELLTLSRAGHVLERISAPGHAESLAWSQGSLWSADGRSPEVTERRDGGRSTVYRLNHVPFALFAKGNSVWTVEKNGHALHQYLISRSILGAMLQPLDLFDVPEVSPEAFAFDDAGNLWIADDETRSLFRMRPEKGAYKIVERAPLSPLLGPAAVFRGLAIDGDAVWILARPAEGGAATIRRIRLDRLDWSAS
ncbi:MAG: hypothetical protein ACHQ51_11545 [Elusimicrobiota bacterium]